MRMRGYCDDNQERPIIQKRRETWSALDVPAERKSGKGLDKRSISGKLRNRNITCAEALNDILNTDVGLIEYDNC